MTEVVRCTGGPYVCIESWSLRLASSKIDRLLFVPMSLFPFVFQEHRTFPRNARHHAEIE